MGDYLGELVAKNIGTADVILPRRQSRFEAAQETDPFEERSEPLSLDRPLEKIAVEPMPPARAGRANQTRQDTNEPPIEVRNNTDDQISQALGNQTPVFERPNKRVDSPEAAPPPKSHEPQLESSASPVRPVPAGPSESPPPKSSEDQHKNKGEIKPKTVETIKLVPIESARPAVKEAGRVPEVDSKASAVAPPEPEIQEKVIEKHSPIVVRPRIERAEDRVGETPEPQMPIRFPRDDDRASEHMEVIEPPAINVSIGRVEVRAVAPSPSPKETRAKQQTLSLEDYLQKRRTGGER